MAPKFDHRQTVTLIPIDVASPWSMLPPDRRYTAVPIAWPYCWTASAYELFMLGSNSFTFSSKV